MRNRPLPRERRATAAIMVSAVMFAVLILPGEAGEKTARLIFTDGMSPHAILMASENFIPPSGSTEYAHIQDDDMVTNSEDGPLRYKLHAETVTREIWEDGFTTAWHRRVVEESSGHFGNHTDVRESWLKDGYVYVSDSRGKWKYAAAPESYQGIGEVEDYLIFVFPERMVASQTRNGNRLKFVLNPEAINERQEAIGRGERFHEANMEAELDDDGETRRKLSVAAYSRMEKYRSEMTTRNELRVLKTGGVTIAYSLDLDTYPERKDPFGGNAGEDGAE